MTALMKKKTLMLTLPVALLSLVAWLVYMKVRVEPLSQALCVAAAEGDTAGVERLLQSGANPNGVGFIPNPDGDCNEARTEDCGPSPPLFLAVTGSPGHRPDPMTTVPVLLRAGADVNAQPENNYRATALMYAAQSNIGVVQALVTSGADVNARDNRGKTALGWALPYDDPQGSLELRHNAEVRRIAALLKKNGVRQ